MAADALGTPAPAATPTVGVVSDEDHRLALAGMIAPQTSSLAVRTGVLWGPGTTALVTGTAATGTMTVSIAVHHAVTTRGTADGIYLGPTLDAATTVNIAAAPASNSRIDVVYVKQNDTSSTISVDSGSTAPIYGVVTGTAAVSPTKPAIPVGAQELATVTVAAGATSTNGAGVTIANTAVQTVARGARIPCRTQAERDALTTFAGLEVYRLDTGAVEQRNAGNTAWLTMFDPAYASAWSTYTPTWTASGAATQPTIGNGILSGRYRKLDPYAGLFKIRLQIGSTTAYGSGTTSNAYQFTLPPGWTNGTEISVIPGFFVSATDVGGLTAVVLSSGAAIAEIRANQNNALIANGIFTGASQYLVFEGIVEF